ncbi:hypothetical protein D4764_15G0010660 [Takifugu flavidus]|uniref:Reverse transcriptase domain-containing protein n=1 Tax=Takifugu flavidus TaxID=433684 RepID=A0A5C6P631_9TELE|nr:hypothetical protein D4764_15G0010660 [Takifugu flavidus]
MIPDSNVTIAGFTTVRADRDTTAAGKKKGGGLAVFVSNRWCSPEHIHVKERVCSPDVELIAIGLRPYYLPREFTNVIAITVYIPPTGKADSACDVIHSVTADLQTKHPGAFILITGDFNHASLKSTLPTFHQYVQCSTRDRKTLDLLYANITNAYTSTALPPLGKSDHNLVLLSPSYTPVVQQQPVTVRTVMKWSDGAMDCLRDALETTNWSALCEPHGEDLDGLTDCVSDYIKFCTENSVPTKKVRCYPNNKPWVTSDLKALLNKKKRAFTAGDPAELRSVQKELKRSLKESKDAYRKKLEERLERNQTRDVWSGMRTITGFQKKGIRSADGNVDQANELNQFFNRFDSSSPSPSCPNIPLDNNGSPSHLPEPLTPLPTSSPSPLLTPYMDPSMSPIPPTGLSFTSGQVRRELERLNQRKAAGPDGISPRVLRNCSRQLCGILQHLFNQSLHLQRIPVLWKTSCLVPVPKKTHPVAPSDYRPIALTSHIMKVMERLVLSHLRPLVSPFQDPLQFAYQPKVGVDDAVIYLLQRAYSSLDRLNTTVRVMFFDFSSAFNTIQPRLLRAKLEKMQMDAPLVSWIEDYLTGRPQFVRLQSYVSDPLMSNTGAPQGTVLSPFLFTTYTADFQYHSETCHLQKYSDDTVIVGCVENGQEDEYRDLVESFVRWSRENLLQLNVTKTKEMVVDFRKSKSPPSPVCISGKEVELVPSYRFLGVQLDNKLEWSTNTDAVYKKAMSRLYFLRRLRSFSVCSRMLHMFYQSVLASTIFFAAVCWGAGIKAKDANRLNKLIKKAGSVVGCRLDNLDEVVRDRMVLKLRTIMDSPSHPLHNTVDKLRSSFSNRLLQPRCSKERYRKSFLPSAIKLYKSLKPTQQ